MQSPFRHTLSALFVATTFSLTGLAAAGEAPVPQSMRIVTPYAPGGSTDVMSRAVATALSRKLGNTIIVENRPGAGSMLGSAYVAKAAPDGATLLLTTSALTIGAGLREKSPYDPVTDFTPVIMISDVPMLLAVPANSPYKTPADFINAARAKPGALNYATSGIGTSNHIAMELLKSAANINVRHVPYKGAGPAAMDVGAGNVQAIIASYSSLQGVLNSGRVRAIAVSSAEPSRFSPGLPPIATVVPGYDVTAWFAVFAPAGTPRNLVDLYNKEIRAITQTEEFTKFLATQRGEASTMDNATFHNKIRQEVADFRRIAREQGIKAE